MSFKLKNYHVVAVIETKITKNVAQLCNISFNNYPVEFTSAESFAGRTLLYITNHLSYKPQNDLQMYEKS